MKPEDRLPQQSQTLHIKTQVKQCFFYYDYQIIIALQMSETDWEIQSLDCHLENKI